MAKQKPKTWAMIPTHPKTEELRKLDVAAHILKMIHDCGQGRHGTATVQYVYIEGKWVKVSIKLCSPEENPVEGKETEND